MSFANTSHCHTLSFLIFISGEVIFLKAFHIWQPGVCWPTHRPLRKWLFSVKWIYFCTSISISYLRFMSSLQPRLEITGNASVMKISFWIIQQQLLWTTPQSRLSTILFSGYYLSTYHEIDSKGLKADTSKPKLNQNYLQNFSRGGGG